MISFLEYVIGEVKERRLAKADAMDLLRQFQGRARKRSSAIHALLHANTSDIEGPRFSSHFTGDERFLSDHVIGGVRMLPGVALLEMARVAVEKATNRKAGGVRLENVMFARPLVVDEPRTVSVVLFAEESGEIGFEISTADVVHCQGHAVLVDAASERPHVDLAALQECCTRSQTASWCYDAFGRMGVRYGEAHRGLESVAGGVDAHGARFLLAKIALPQCLSGAKGARRKYTLHPSLMDAALQAIIGWEPETRSGRPALPFAVEQVDVFAPSPVRGYAYLRSAAEDGSALKLDVYVCDEQGRACARLRGVTFRQLAAESKHETVLFRPHWRAEVAGDAEISFEEHWIVAPESILDGQSFPGARSVSLPPADGGAQCATDSVRRVLEAIQEILRGKPQREVLLQVVVPAGVAAYAGLSGLLKSARLEDPRLIAQCIEIEPDERMSMARILRENAGAPHQQHIRHQATQRHVLAWEELSDGGQAKPWKDGGVYLIAGGGGGLGLLFAREIAAQTRDSAVILTGRSPREIEPIGGARLEYQRVDVADRAAVVALVADIVTRFGRLDGVIHAAGVIRDRLLIHKTADEVDAVLASKIAGAIHLDEATRHLPLDLFVLFSSLAGATGNVGQADYAAANAFLDGFARSRKERHGRSISINWPLWADGGMRVDESTAARMRQSAGLAPLDTASGLRAFYAAIGSGEAQVMVMAGDGARIRTAVAAPRAAATRGEAPANAAEIATDALHARAVQELRRLVASVQKLEIDRVEADVPFDRYGIDSIRVMQMTSELEKTYGSLPKTLFFEHASINALASYFVARHRPRLAQLVGSGARKVDAQIPAVAATPARRRARFASATAVRPPLSDNIGSNDIAIIGISGRYPRAADLAEFWENLKSGRDCITEIPAERWDHEPWFDAQKGKPGKSYSKWGGFIDGVDRFDPLFFNISPREAALMDPQERLFLQCVYETLEDAGHTRESVARRRGEGADGKVGVFVGVMYQEYQLFGAQAQALGQGYSLPGNPSLIANRVSYFCNFHGPSLALDTMCSSSLTALHLACQSLRRGECDVAVAGGVNVSIHPNKYLGLAQGQFASSHGRCESFGEGGDGYVPGEGVGAVLLKPLARAIADGDRIHGVIKATAVNHGGRTNGFSVPNPQSQADVIAEALKSSGVPARAISYLEAHGTGTKLGDPIEIAGLTKAFSALTPEMQFCAIGSVKSNIGHCESAAGMAGLAKILLQMRHGLLAPSLHTGTLNPHIDFESTPFVVQRELGEWKRPVIDGRELPRVAGLSSFGAGGSNAHVVIEEYVAPAAAPAAVTPAIVVLSAKSGAQLEAQAKNLLRAVEGMADADLADVAYTLQTGREAMEHRLAMTVASIAELREKLGRILASEREIEGLYRGEVKRNKEALAIFTADEEMQEALDKWLARGKYGRLLELWVKGLQFDWSRLYGAQKPRRIGLPTYPFARERYWVPTLKAASAAQAAVLHPLLHANTSSLSEQRFTSTFTGEEFFLADHIVRGARVLPGVAYLEMARAAVAAALERNDAAMTLRDVVWSRPFSVSGEPATLHVALTPEDSGEIAVEIYSGDDTLHAQAIAALVSEGGVRTLDLSAFQPGVRITPDRLYGTHKALGIDYGPAHLGVTGLATGTDEHGGRFAIVDLQVPGVVAGTRGAYVLHPTILDSALHASLGLSLGDAPSEERRATWVPFALDRLTVLRACPERPRALIREVASAGANVRKLDVDICDAEGQVCVELRGFAARALESETDEMPLLTFTEAWTPAARPPLDESDRDAALRTVVIGGSIPLENAIVAEDLSDVDADDALVYFRDVRDLESAFAFVRAAAQKNVRRIVLAAQFGDAIGRCYADAWLGFARSLRNARITVVAGSTADAGEWARRIDGELRAAGPENVLYEGTQRFVCSVRPTVRTSAPAVLRRGGTYLITGGAGGLGLALARSLAGEYAANLILTGRSPLGEAKRASLPAGARYVQADVCDLPRMREVIEDAVARFGRLDGVVHAAGVEAGTRPLAEVLAPKVEGTLVLDEALHGRELDFICYFSSSSAILGDFGSCDYAVANRFQTAFARTGGRKRVAINWPLWKDGGMGADEAAARAYLQGSGQRALETAEGLRLFERLIAEEPPQQLVLAGHPARMQRLLGIAPAAAAKAVASRADGDVLRTRTIAYLTNVLSATLRMPAERIDPETAFEQYGIDSVIVLQLTGDLEKTFGTLPKTLFFEYQDLDALAGYFLEAHRGRLVSLFGGDEKSVEARPVAPVPAARARRRSRFAPATAAQPRGEAAPWRDIAIIGMSGRYPRAANLEIYWENLKNGRDCITEVPKNRWDLGRWFDAEKGKAGKTYSRWGGFIDGVDEFDPTFFNVSPREAEGMDPQERLFLQCVYETIEDAGYTRESLARHGARGLEGNVGVFVGVMYEEYQLFGAQAQAIGRPFALPGNPATIANRVSYFFNFHGPSMSVDTMCSSSLTSIHLASESLQRGGCELAVAGGVNVSIHPNKYLALSQGHFLSSEGRCESFGEGGDGFVPGEGVGAVLLKPLSAAIADGDHIYGVIKATAINHGGKTNGYSVPNPVAQANVIVNALRESGIPPRAVSYIEAHGTGTKLGDPIEIAGLARAFAQWTQDTQFCAIGSAKSNIGHCESAAGIAAVTKVLLQMQHGQIAPSLHAETLNPHIDFAASPFIVQRELGEWKRPVIGAAEVPRIAGVSSFGAGGANAHIVIQEHIAPAAEEVEASPAVIVLSAKSAGQLEQQVANLLRAIETRGPRLADVAYTLQVGREAMEHRLAMTVASMSELRDTLSRVLAGETNLENVYRGDAKGNRAILSAFTTDDDLQKAVLAWAAKGKYDRLLDLWVRGLVFDWRALYGDVTPRRVSLPTYPFAKERCWAVPSVDVLTVNTLTTAAALHPLLHENTSDLGEQRFTSRFTGEEPFLADHRVRGARVLPGAAYLEMARAAVARAAGAAEHAVSLKNIAWSQPFAVGDGPGLVNLALVPEESGAIAFEAYSDQGIHAQGVALVIETTESAALDLDALRAHCSTELPAETVYAMHKALGIDYGPSMRGVRRIASGIDANGRTFALAEVSAPDAGGILLHPALLDSALHAAVGFFAGERDRPATWLPFGLDELTILGPVPTSAQVVIRDAAGTTAALRKLDVDLCDARGNVCVRMRGFTARALETTAATPIVIEEVGPVPQVREKTEPEDLALLTFTEQWQEQPLPARTNAPRTIVCLLAGEEVQRAAADAWKRIAPEVSTIFADTPAAAAHHDADAILDLRPIEERSSIRDFDAVASLIRALAAAKSKCARLILAAEVTDETERCTVESWLGLTRSLRPVLPDTRVSVVATALAGKGKSKASSAMHQWAQRLWAELCSETPENAFYESGKRHTLRVEPASRTDDATPLRRNGTYLITGGAGGLGLAVASRLVSRYAANVILTGRSAADPSKLQVLGDHALYLQADVCDAEQMRRAFEQGRDRFGAVHGVIHAAGLQNRKGILAKTADEIRGVLAPKVDGSLVLHELARDLARHQPLDFLCHFSSTAAVLGDFGACDYAVANRFQLAQAQARKPKVNVKTILWPLWKEGTMSVGDEATTQAYLESTGQRALETEEALDLFEQLLGEPASHQIVMAGRPSQVKRMLGLGGEPVPAVSVPEAPRRVEAQSVAPADVRVTATTLESNVIQHLQRLLSASTKLPIHRIEADAPFDTFGLDSVMVLQLTAELEKHLGSLSKTLFFEFRTIEALAAHLIAGHRDALARLFGGGEEQGAPPVASAPRVAEAVTRRRARFAPHSTKPAAASDIAIIGITGRFPQAPDLDALWANLRAGKDCIEEIPAARWDHAAYFDPRRGKAGKSYSKWGGFIEGVDRFDPLFFNISPREAQLMDPQERLFLETVWNLLETSGLTRESLQQRYNGKVGVYAGSMYPQYGFFNSRSAIANRVSYFFGLEGPSVTIDTMCSSAAVAIHNACGDLLRGDCALAIAGGVNLSTHPRKYVALSQGQLIGSSPASRSFARGGDGYLPAETVGAVLLKPLAGAVADGDEILAVIKATAVNHGGRSNGYSVPSPNAQAEVIEETIRKAGIDARTITCVEAAATGSALGDPIEVTALNKAFAATKDRAFCSIGSVKSNIGHAEGASGIAQIAKVVLQLRHKQLVPSIGADVLNPNLTFDGTAFRLQRDLCEWSGGPRRALVNSFGAGGTNACLLLEEYVAPPRAAVVSAGPQVIVVSARSPERLAVRVSELLGHLERHEELALADLAYTLQLGREAMSSRLAVVVNDRAELLAAWREWLAGAESPVPRFAGELSERSTVRMLTSGRAGEAMVQVLLAERALEKIALLWTEGSRIPWASLHEGQPRRTVALPTYPFEREHLPLPDVEPEPQPAEGDPIAIVAEERLPVARKGNVIAPRTDLERAIAAIWEEALGVTGIGVEDSFLELGGNSLQAAHILARLQELFTVEVPLQSLLGAEPTVAGMAVAIVTALMKLESAALEESAVPISPA